MKNMKEASPQVIAFEGVNGSGKTTTINAFQDRLDAENIPSVILEIHPRSAVRGLLLNDPEYTSRQRLLYLGLVSIEVANKVKAALSEGKWVLLDRSPLSRTVYQHMTDGLSLECKALDSITGPFPHIDHLVFLDIDYQEAKKRCNERPPAVEAEAISETRRILVFGYYKQALEDFTRLQEHLRSCGMPSTNVMEVDAMNSAELNASMLAYSINDLLEMKG